MLRVGLTGGIGSGKSTVSALLAEHGAVVIDADLLAREVVAPGTPGLAEVVAEFGDDVLLPDGALDRATLGRRVFGDPPALQRLNAVLHPRIGALTVERYAAAEAAGAEVVVHDVPLLVENGLAPAYDVVVVVAASPATQLRRLVAQRAMSEADAQARIGAQAPLADRLAVARHVIHNDGELAALAPQVEQLWAAVLATTRRAAADGRAGRDA